MKENHTIQEPNEETSLGFRARDRILYLAFGWYVAATVGLLALLYGSIAGNIFLGTIVPGFALICLIVFQVLDRPLWSPLAFCLVFVGLLTVAFVVLNIAAAASAAV